MQETVKPQTQKSWLKKFKLGLAISLSLAAAIIIAQNRAQVTLRAFWAELNISLALLLGFTFLLGALCGFIFALWPKTGKKS